MPRKTDTIKQRSLYIYLPSVEMTERWKQIAKERHVSLSRFVLEVVQKSLSEEDKAERYNEVVRSRKELREQVSEMTKKLKRDEMLIDRLEAELRDLRAQPFLVEGYKGERAFPQDLVALLKAGKVRYEDIHARLGIEPGSDASRALQVQLNTLKEYGLIKMSDRFIRWVETKEE